MRLPELARRAAAVLAVLAALAGALWLAYLLRGVLLPFALGLALAYVLSPAVDALCRRGLSRRAAIAAVFAGLAVVAALTALYLVPMLLRELDELAGAVPELARRAQAALDAWGRRYDRAPLPPAVRGAIDAAAARAAAAVQGLAALAVERAMAGAAAVLALVLAPFLAYYMLRDLDLFRARFMGAIPARWRPRAAAVLRDLDRVLGGFVRGQLLVALIMGGAVALLTALLGLPFPLLLGLAVGLGELVPYFGPVIGSLPAVAVAALQSPAALLRLVVFLLVLHELEQAVLTPRILGAGVGLHPLAVVFALLLGAELMGVFGMLVAVPVTAALVVLVRHAVAEVASGRVGGRGVEGPPGGDGRAHREPEREAAGERPGVPAR